MGSVSCRKIRQKIKWVDMTDMDRISKYNNLIQEKGTKVLHSSGTAGATTVAEVAVVLVIKEGTIIVAEDNTNSFG